MRKGLFSHRLNILLKMIGSACGSVLILMLTVSVGSAFKIPTEGDWKISWDNTVKYSMGFRLEDKDADLISGVNNDDGDRNFDKGLISARFDLLSELDIVYQNVGFRVSGAAWYDPVYHGSNDNDSPATNNSVTVPYDEFTEDTKDMHGGDVDLLDAFFFAKGKLGGKPASIRAGRHTLLWGEALFFAGNGICAGQAPVDVVKALSVPGTKAKELFLPVNQVSGQVNLIPGVTLAGYYQLEWRKSRMPEAGSYFSDIDIADDAGQSLVIPGLGTFYRGDDLEGSNDSQYGISLRLRPRSLDMGIGLYYLKYHQKNQYWAYLDPAAGQYYLVYPKNIHVVGASLSSQIGEVNVSGEVSGRFNAPLISDTQVATSSSDNDKNNLYAIGNTFHANLSAIAFLGPTFLWEGGDFLAELAYEAVIDEKENESTITSTRDDYAWGVRMVLTPAYYQVFPGIDLKVPLGFGYTGKGASATDLKFNGGAVDGGDISIGLSVDYLTVWKFGIKYNIYYGTTDYQTLADRDFITMSIEHTF